MANEFRVTVDGFYGQLGAGITAVATSITDPAFSALPVISGGSAYIPLTFNDISMRLQETVWITAHASNSTTVTVSRAKEGTVARDWPTSTPFAQADTQRDGLIPTTSVSTPTELHTGARFTEGDTGAIRVKTAASGILADVGVALPGEVGPTRAGTNPGVADVITIRAGNTTATTNGSGDGSVTFRQPFPFACACVVANPGDPAFFTGTLTIQGESVSGFNFRAMSLPGSIFVGSLRIQYIAIGW